MEPITPTARTQVARRRERGVYDRELIHSILDEGLICHTGFVVNGQPYVIPTIYARIGDRLYLHGSVASRMLKTLRGGVEACVTVTLVDALVLARSAFHHSMNYRSVVVLGMATEVTDPEEKKAAFTAFVEHVCPGRSADVRAPDEQETKATMVVSMAIEEASAKVRTGPVSDAEEDYALTCWAGLLPLRMQASAPEPDAELAAGTPIPSAIARYTRGNTRMP